MPAVYNGMPRQSVLRELDADIAVRHPAIMIALEEERARLTFVAVERPACDPGDLNVLVYRFSVAHNRQVAAHQGDIEGLPFARAERHRHLRLDEAVQRSHLVAGLCPAFGA